MAIINFRFDPNVNDLENEPTRFAAAGKRRFFAAVKFGENIRLRRGIEIAFRFRKSVDGPAKPSAIKMKSCRPHCLRRKIPDNSCQEAPSI